MDLKQKLSGYLISFRPWKNDEHREFRAAIKQRNRESNEGLMNKYVVCLFSLIIASLWAPAEEKPKLALAEVSLDSVSVTGVWRPDNPTKENNVIEAVYELTCFRHGGKTMVGTEAWCLEAAASAPMGMLDVSTNWLKVIEWSKTQLIATNDSHVCATTQTTVDLQTRTAIDLDIRKTNATGLNNVCKSLPERQTYYLQDKVDYFVNKALHP